MTCPQCGADCTREEVDVGVGLICSPWVCTECNWDEDCGFPMSDVDWCNKFKEEDLNWK
jgi:hypothetical protein